MPAPAFRPHEIKLNIASLKLSNSANEIILLSLLPAECFILIQCTGNTEASTHVSKTEMKAVVPAPFGIFP